MKRFLRLFTGFSCLFLPIFFLLWAGLYLSAALTAWMPVELDNVDQVITVRLLDFPKRRETRWVVDVYSRELSGKIRLSFPEQVVPEPNCLYSVKVRLKQPRGFVNFNQFDYQAWLLQANYVATGSVREILKCEPIVIDSIFSIRIAIADDIQKVEMSEQARSTLLALLIGSYADIDMQQWRLLRDSGTIHILSVSGLHIVLVSSLAYFIFANVSRYLLFPVRILPAAHWGGFASIFFSIAYALLADFSVPTQRSLIMVAVAVIQRLLYSRFRLLAAWKISLLIVLLSNPLSVLSCGFWFSFVGTAVLILVFHGVNGKVHWLWRYCVTNWLLFLSMVPLSLYLYGYVPVLSLPANLMAVPLISFLSLPLAFLGLLFMPVSGFLSDGAFQLSALTLDVYWYLMDWLVSAASGLKLYWGGATIGSVALALVGFSLLLLPKAAPLRFFACLLWLPLIFPSIVSPRQDEFEVTVLDVGQGLAVVVRTAKHILVYDTGDRFSQQFDSGTDIVVPFLRNLREPFIDMLMISHSDKDHSGGMQGVLNALPVHQFWSGTPELLHASASFNPCRAGMHWRWEGVDFQLLNPVFSSEHDQTNNRSCVLRIDNGLHSVLLTGDAEQLVEARLLRQDELLQSDILVAPHHGSNTSSSMPFIRAVNPRLVVISAGYKNRFHHPNAAVLARYTRQGLPWLSTAEQGAIRIRTDAGDLRLTTALCAHPVPWRSTDACQQDRL